MVPGFAKPTSEPPTVGVISEPAGERLGGGAARGVGAIAVSPAVLFPGWLSLLSEASEGGKVGATNGSLRAGDGERVRTPASGILSRVAAPPTARCAAAAVETPKPTVWVVRAPARSVNARTRRRRRTG